MTRFGKTMKLLFCGAMLPATHALSQAASEEGVTLAPVVVNATAQHGNVTEGTGRYTIPTMRAATGLVLSPKETPQSVSVITSQQIKDQNLDTLAKILESTPGISVLATDRGRHNFSARGFSIDRYMVDGMAVGWNGAWVTGESTLDSAIYDHVEVVRGATGLTTGAGDPSAAVNLVRKHADSQVPLTMLDAGIGRHGDWQAGIDHTQPFNADASVRGRLVAHHRSGKTFIDREKIRRNTLYAVIDADVSERTRLSAGVSYQQDDKDSAMWGGLPAFFSDGSHTDWAREKNASTNWAYWNNKTTNYFFQASQRLGERWNLGLKANRRVGEGDSKLFYFSGNSVNKVDGLGWSPSPGKFFVESKQTNVQLQADGKFTAWGLDHDLVIGAQYNRRNTVSSAADIDSLSPASNFFNWDGGYPEPKWGASRVRYDHTIRENGIYAAARLRLSGQLAVIAGSRLSRWRSEGISYGSSLNYESDTVWTPYAGVLYDITPRHTVYASYTDIFRPQQQRDINNKLLDPVRGHSYEIGWKSSLMNGGVDTQISLFQTRQDNLAQNSGQTIPGTNPAETAYYAAKGAKVKGFEIEASGNISPELKLGVGYTQWRGKDRNGNAINTTHPRKQFKFFASYDMNRVLPGLTVGGGVNWQSRIYGMANRREFGQDSYALVNLMARYRINTRLSAQFNVDNLFDKKYRNQLGWGQYNYGEPRYIGASIHFEH